MQVSPNDTMIRNVIIASAGQLTLDLIRLMRMRAGDSPTRWDESIRLKGAMRGGMERPFGRLPDGGGHSALHRPRHMSPQDPQLA